MHINHNLLPPSRIRCISEGRVRLGKAASDEGRVRLTSLAGTPQRSRPSTDTITGGWGELPLWARFVCPGYGT